MSTTTVELWGDEYRSRTDRKGDDGTACAVCGRKARGPLHVNADNGPHWYGDDMGWHPIGSECAKKARAAGWTVEALTDIQAGTVA